MRPYDVQDMESNDDEHREEAHAATGPSWLRTDRVGDHNQKSARPAISFHRGALLGKNNCHPNQRISLPLILQNEMLCLNCNYTCTQKH